MPDEKFARMDRREMLAATSVIGVAAAVGLAGPAFSAPAPKIPPQALKGVVTMNSITTKDGVSLYYKDWGPRNGQVVTLSHGWPLSSDSWESASFFLANQGYRVVAHDRRGHGRSSQPWDGNDMDHYADDLATVIESLGLRDVSMFGFSTGGGEVARYVGRHGTSRVKKLGLISAVPPLIVQTPDHPEGIPKKDFDDIRASIAANRSQVFRDIPSGPFYGFNRPGVTPNQAMIDYWWMQAMMGGFKNTYDSVAAFSETDFRGDLKKFDKPTLIIHGGDDQIVPINEAGRASKKLIPHAELIVYDGAPHGLPETHKDRFHQDILKFLKS